MSMLIPLGIGDGLCNSPGEQEFILSEGIDGSLFALAQVRKDNHHALQVLMCFA